MRHAGAVFLGGHTPEVVGDYVAGPNHVLPTAGTARFASPLGDGGLREAVERDRVLAAAGCATPRRTSATLTRVEGLAGHGNAAELRLRTRRRRNGMSAETTARQARVERKTKETEIALHLNLDGTGASKVQTPIPFFSHMLEAWSKHGLMDLTVDAQGDVEVDLHHTVEDVGIVLGQALRQALGDKQGDRALRDRVHPDGRGAGLGRRSTSPADRSSSSACRSRGRACPTSTSICSRSSSAPSRSTPR